MSYLLDTNVVSELRKPAAPHTCMSPTRGRSATH